MTTTAAEYLDLERLYAEKPAAYRRKVLGLISVGYLYIVVVAVVIIGFVAGGALLFATGKISFIWLDNFAKIAVPALIVAGLMARSIFVSIPKPEGLYLQGALKDKVLAFVEGVRSAANGKSIDEVVITDELNAAVQQMPKFGVFGPTTNYLIIGVPLLQLMTAEEVRAVIAHEFGHLSHEHGRMGGMVYRLNQTLVAAAAAISEKTKHGGSGWTYKALNWFFRKFNALTFPMRRGQEYEADAVACRVTNADVLSSALCRLYAMDAALGSYWNETWRQSRHQEANTNLLPHSGMRRRIDELVDATGADAAVEAAMQNETDFSDSHPCLRDRLAAMNVGPCYGLIQTGGAIDEVFSVAEKEEFLGLADRHWQSKTQQNWQASHEQYRAAEEELVSLRQGRASLDAPQLLRLASLEEQLGSPDDATGVYRDLVERHSDSAIAQFHWGRLHVERDLQVAEQALAKCLDLDLEFYPDVAPLLQRALAVAGRDNDFSKYAAKRDAYEQLVERAKQERASVSPEDELSVPQLNKEFAAALQEFLQQYTEIRKLYVVQKPMQTFADDAVYILGFDVNYYHGNVESDVQKWASRVTGELSRAFPGLNNPFFVVLEKDTAWQQTFESLPGALMFEGAGKEPRSFLGYVKLVLYWIIGIILAIYFAILAYEKITGTSLS